MDEVKFAPWHDDVSEHKGYTGVPALAYADSMSSKIAQAKQKVPPDLQNNGAKKSCFKNSDTTNTLYQQRC